MIQINCTLVGTITSPPILSIFGNPPDIAELETPTRAIFKLADSEASKLAKFIFGSQTLDYVTPPMPGAYEGPNLVYQSLIEVLHIERDKFVTPANPGQNWLWKGHIDFMRYKQSLEGIIIEPLLQPMYNVGSRVVCTLMSAHYIQRFYPIDYGDRFYEHIKPFARALAKIGFYWQPILLADAQVIMPNKQNQRQHVDRMLSQMVGESNILPSLANEYQKNGVDPADFQKPNGILISRGSTVSDTAPYEPGWDWKEWHPRRDWPKVLFGNDDAWYVKEGVDANLRFRDRSMPCVVSEPIGFWDRDIPGRRSSDPNVARIIGGTSIYFANGGNFHSEEGLNSQPWSVRTGECAVQFFKGINQQ